MSSYGRDDGWSKRQFMFAVLALGTVVLVVGILAGVSVFRYRIDSEINQQTVVERTQLQEQRKLEQTREHLKWLPWYKGEE